MWTKISSSSYLWRWTGIAAPGATSEISIDIAAPVATREPVTIAEGVWAWGRVPESPRVYYYTDVDEITDVIATLHVIVP